MAPPMNALRSIAIPIPSRTDRQGLRWRPGAAPAARFLGMPRNTCAGHGPDEGPSAERRGTSIATAPTMLADPPSREVLAHELEQFDRLKPRLVELWREVFPRDDQAYTSVVVPSLTLEGAELARLRGATFYEERLLFLLIRLRNPHARLVYVTSQPVHPNVLEYYLEMLAGIPASHARSRLTLLCAYDGSPRPLTQKILERPRLIERIRVAAGDPMRAYLTVFNSTPLERRLAVRLDMPLNGVDPELAHHGTKSGSRKVFREAGVACPDGFEDLRSGGDVEEALAELRGRRPGLRRAVVKLDESFSGEGNAIFRYPEDSSRAALR